MKLENRYDVIILILILLVGVEMGFVVGCLFQQYLFNNPLTIDFNLNFTFPNLKLPNPTIKA